ncbi:hypothetical protein BD410DRAFT_784841 [Rickenella mellea]|uniref:Uncharacterized protein n=1 Tax=Rickenella mellea TaxID=50990 RepID=A0A4Y7QEI3_9AGAM|nr:hypothetical protein BD410DRAFT_784841 [Rickenella mellea]
MATRRGVWPCVLIVLLCIFAISWYGHIGTSLQRISWTGHGIKPDTTNVANPQWDATTNETHVEVEIRPRRPKITVIAIWSPRAEQEPNYLPYFFQSVEVNPEVNLLLINIKKTDSRCTSPHTSARNVKELCVTLTEYLDLHVEFLCKRWQCIPPDRKILLEHITKQHKSDKNFSFFRILRSGIFERWIDPDTTIWGWCDLDVYWGNFERTFPWDIASEFDIIAIKSQPDFRPQQMLFARGHMAFFRHTPAVLDMLHSYPAFISLGHFLLSPMLRVDCEESQFSNYMFSKNTNFTYIHLEGMIQAYQAAVASVDGTYYFNYKKEDATLDVRRTILSLVRPQERVAVTPTFTEDGVEEASEAKTTGFEDKSLWFPLDLVVYAESGWTAKQREEKAYFMRRIAGGNVTQRRESRGRYVQKANKLVVDEGLYKHFQAEKLKAWFKRVPAKAWDPSHTYIQWKGLEAEIWDADGNVIFESGQS